MLDLTESAAGLVVAAPTWVVVLMIGLGIAVALATLRGKHPRGMRFGGGVLVLAMFFFAWKFHSTSTTFDGDGVVVRDFLGGEEPIAWKSVARFAIQQYSRGGARGSSYLVLYLRAGGEIAIKIEGLSGSEISRLYDFVKVRVV